MTSPSRFAVTWAAVAAGLVLVQTSAIDAQVRPQGNQRQLGQMRNLPQLETQGTVDVVAVNAMKITSDTKQTWILAFSPATRVEIKGAASADMLTHGTYISFSAEVNHKTSRVEEKVSKLAIFVPSNRMQVGAVPEGSGEVSTGFGLNVGGDQPFGAAAGAGGKAAGKAGKASSKAPAKGAGKASAKASETYDIKGQITSIKGSRVTLKVPNQHFKSTLRIELAEEPEVTLDIEGTLANCPPLPSLVKPGDRVEVKGAQVAENRGNVADLKITLGGAAGEEPVKKGAGKADGAAKEPGKARGKAAKGAKDEK